MDQDEKATVVEECASTKPEQCDDGRAIPLTAPSPSYISGFSEPASGLFSFEQKPEDPIISFEHAWRTPSAFLGLEPSESAYALNSITIDAGNTLRLDSRNRGAVNIKTSSPVLLTEEYHLSPTNKELAKQIEKLSDEVKELEGQLAQQQKAEGPATGQCNRRGRPPLGRAEWEERFQTVRDIEQTHQDRGISYEQACARHYVSYSTFRHWRQKMKADK